METTLIKSQYELERGKPMPSKKHAIIQMKLGHYILSNYPKFWALPELSLLLNEKELIPDLAVYTKADFDDTKDEIKTIQVPICTIEILSPTQNIGDLLIKAKYYFNAGVQSYWLIIPALEAVFIYKNETDYEVYKMGEVLIDKTLNFEIPVHHVF